jgi:hypothetical protein
MEGCFLMFTYRLHYNAAGENLYAILFDENEDCWDGDSFEAFTGVHDTFKIAVVEEQNNVYKFSIDEDIKPGTYAVEFWKQIGGSASRVNDTFIEAQELYWTGGRFFPRDSIQIGGTQGSRRKVYRVKDKHGEDLPGVFVWVCSDSSGYKVKAFDVANEDGEAVFWLDPGTYYVFKIKIGYNFDNPEELKIT